MRNPNWTRDEAILALDMYLQYMGNPPGKDSPEVRALSELLNASALRDGVVGSHKFRNPSGVYMKMMNFRRLDPTYSGVGLQRGAHEDERVWKEFAGDPKRCTAVAEAIRAAAASPEALGTFQPDEMQEAEEGRLLSRLHITRERNRAIVAAKKAACLKKAGCLACEVCGFDYRKRYGDRGEGYIECHHTRPVYTLRPGHRTKLEDLALICANCHRMVHVRSPWLSLEQLRSVLSPI